MEQAVFFKVLPYLIYFFAVIMALTSSLLIYTGLASQTERMQTRLRIKQSLQKNREKLAQSASRSGTEEWMKKANYPLGLNAFKYQLIFYAFILFLLINYLVLPALYGGEIKTWTLIGIIIAFVLLLPSNPYSLFVYVMKRVIDYKEAKKNAEVFMLYDLLINELESMTNSRINTYNILRNIKPFFDVISGSFAILLTSWSSDEGPEVALDKFAKDIGTQEAKSLVSVMKNLDEVNIETALKSLKGMNDMFVRSQIENYRRRRKVTTDLASIPIKTTHFLIILDFLVVIIVMVSYLMDNSNM
ncbi:hypothetical protein NC797_07255 [Aquibacillus sp. 3ASR75-11]|uniref:Uncharacterized protein n=1 Tax=Terrihalobacillus insolitus TaxID=2950438 RepID=A0A9X3WRZ4_9BACI|nr:hypothetical protein [Terrihalobacillus insolitus]MDC3424305.1 hypothetical protein [Terrihalobacillus insolitus]